MRYSERKQEVSYTGFEIVRGDCRCNRTPPILNCVTRVDFLHNSTATKNTSLQSVRDMMVIAIPWNAPLKRSALNIDAGQVSNLPSPIISAMMRITRSGGLSVLILLPLHILLKQPRKLFA